MQIMVDRTKRPVPEISKKMYYKEWEEAGSVPKWRYADELSFIRPFLQERETVGNLEDGNEGLENIEAADEIQSLTAQDQCENNPSQKHCEENHQRVVSKGKHQLSLHPVST